MKRKPIKICKLSSCNKPLLLSNEQVNGCCCESHALLWKKMYNANYYQQRTEVIHREKYSNMLRSCMKQFGEQPIEAEILALMGFDWEFSNIQVEIDRLQYTVIGDYAYAVFKNKKLKILKYE